MPALQVRDFPADLYEELRIYAAEESRSISQQVVVIIKDFLSHRGEATERRVSEYCAPRSSYNPAHRDPVDLDRRREVLRKLNELPSIPVTKDCPSSAELLRQIREEEAR